MKRTSRYLALALCSSGAILSSARADKVQWNQLPLELRGKIQAYSGSARIEDIDRDTKNGQTVYSVAFKENGQNKELNFDSSGRLLDQNGTTALDSRKVTFNDLPDAVKKSLQTRTTPTQIDDIDRQVKNGEVTYEIGFKSQGDHQQELVISQDGRILQDGSTATALGSPASPGSGNAGSTPAARTQVNAFSKPAPLSAGQKVDFNSLPQAVKTAITTAANGARIEDVERGVWHGQSIYQAAFKDPNNQNVELQVRENGTIFFDPRNATAVGRPASVVAGRRSSRYPNVTNSVQLSASQKVERSSLPAAVEQTLRTAVGDNRIEDIERGSWRGMNVYEAAFHENGKLVELQVDEKGNVVFDPRTK